MPTDIPWCLIRMGNWGVSERVHFDRFRIKTMVGPKWDNSAHTGTITLTYLCVIR